MQHAESTLKTESIHWHRRCARRLPGVVILKHAWDVYRAVSPVSRAPIVETDSIPDTLESSDTLSKHVNPAGHVALRDTRYIDVNASLGHEQVLVSFMHGFFGGRVFSIERALLRFFCPELVDYKGTLCRPQRSFRRAAVTGIPKDLVCPGIERSPKGELPPIWGFPRFRRLSRGRLQLHRHHFRLQSGFLRLCRRASRQYIWKPTGVRPSIVQPFGQQSAQARLSAGVAQGVCDAVV